MVERRNELEKRKRKTLEGDNINEEERRRKC